MIKTKNIVLFLAISAILAAFPFAIEQIAFADKDSNNGNSNGCENANENSKVNEKNPHCDEPVLRIFFHDADGKPIKFPQCYIYALPHGVIEEGVGNANGIYSTMLETDVDFSFFDISCVDTNTGIGGRFCEVQLESEGTTEVNIQIGTDTNCVGV